MAPIIVTTEPSRWSQLVLYSTALAVATYMLQEGLALGTSRFKIDLSSPTVQRALAAIVWAPCAWNVFPRLEYRHRIISGPLRSRTAALYLFALYIVCFSSFREAVFFDAIKENPVWSTGVPLCDRFIVLFGSVCLGAGAILSASGFYHLRITYTYMGEYFGFMMSQLVTSFPFNFAPDPMYNGSVLMHYGYALRALSPTGFFLALVVALSYWIAAKIFEEPFMMYCYSKEKDAAIVSENGAYQATLNGSKDD